MADEFLSQEEVNALLAELEEEKREGHVGGIATEGIIDDRPVELYNFRRPDRVSKEQLRSLELMHEAFSRNLAISLSGFLRTLTEVKLISVDQLSYNEFVTSLPNPTSFTIMSIAPLEGNIVIELNPAIAFPVVDRLLGGTGRGISEMREMTDIELQIVEGFLSRVTLNLRAAWRELVDINFKIQTKETNPHIAQIVSPAEIVVLLLFEIKFPGASGFMNICIPFISIENLAEKLTLQYRFAGTKKGRDFSQDRMRDMMMKVRVPMTAYLGKMQLTVEEILHLRIGDTILLNKAINEELEIKVANRKKFAARPGLRNRKKAVQVLRVKDADT